MAVEQTDNYGFSKVADDQEDWNNLVTANWEALDDLLSTYIVVPAGAGLDVNDAVYLNSDGKIYKAHCDTLGTSACLGLVVAAAGLDEEVKVRRVGLVEDAGWAWPTPGVPIYLHATTSGGLSTSGGTYMTPLGFVVDATHIFLLPGLPPNAYAFLTALIVGTIYGRGGGGGGGVGTDQYKIYGADYGADGTVCPHVETEDGFTIKLTQTASSAQAEVTPGNSDNEIGGLTFSNPPTQAECEALRDKCEELADDVRNLATLANALRTALVADGLIKGSA